jgi:hypothetical protein
VPSVSSITHNDAFRANVFQDFTPAYLQRMGGAKRSYFTIGFPRLIVCCNAVRNAPVFETGTTATGSTKKWTTWLTLPTVGQEDNSLSQIAIKMHFLFLERHDANLSAIARALLRCR